MTTGWPSSAGFLQRLLHEVERRNSVAKHCKSSPKYLIRFASQPLLYCGAGCPTAVWSRLLEVAHEVERGKFAA